MDQNVAFLKHSKVVIKSQNWELPAYDSFQLIVSHIDDIDDIDNALQEMYKVEKRVTVFVLYCLLRGEPTLLFGKNVW